jgi:hypothetical protein
MLASRFDDNLEVRLPADRVPRNEAEAEGQFGFDIAASAALFVGVSSFEDERIHAIPYAVDDAVDLAYLFTFELGLISPERTILLLAGEPQKPRSIEHLERLGEGGAHRKSARMTDFYRYLGELIQATEEPGLFVLAVATHGVSDQGGDFLLATDSLRQRMLRTGIAVAEVFDEVSRARAGRRLVLLDACRERLTLGTRGEEHLAMTQSFADAIALAKGLVVLSAATLGGFAYDDSVRKNGVFTAAVLDGLHGEAPAGPEGWITVRTLADFVQQRVAAWTRRYRPDHVAKSLGIAKRVEATAEALPLARHPETTRELQRYRARRDSALLRFKENQGKVLSGALWDEVYARLPEEKSSPEAERLLEEIEALDGTERAQRSLRDFLRELQGGVSPPPPVESGKVREEVMEQGKAAEPPIRKGVRPRWAVFVLPERWMEPVARLRDFLRKLQGGVSPPPPAESGKVEEEAVEQGKTAEPPIRKGVRPRWTAFMLPERWRAPVAWSAGVIAVIVLVLLTDLYVGKPPGWKQTNEEFEPRTLPPQSQITDFRGDGVVHPAEKPTAPLEIILDFSTDCWVEVTVDGKPKIAEQRVQGESLQIDAQKSVSIKLGNAGAVDVQVNGYPFDFEKQPGKNVELLIDLDTLKKLKRASR